MHLKLFVCVSTIVSVCGFALVGQLAFADAVVLKQDQERNVPQSAVAIDAPKSGGSLGMTSQPETQSIPSDPGSFSDGYRKAISLYKQGHLAAAEKLVELSLMASPQDAQMHGLLGYIYAKQGKSESAVSELEAATHLDPNDLPSQNNLAQSYLSMHRYEDAARVCRRVILVKPSDPVANTNLGIALVELQDLQGAVSAFRSAAAVRPNTATLENLGAVDVRTGDFAGAVEVFSHETKLAPNNANLWLNLGMSQLRLAAKKGETQDLDRAAVVSLRKSIALDTDYKYDAHFALGQTYAELSETSFAIKQFEIASQIRPAEFEPWFNLGVLNASVNNIADAIASYRSALGVKSSDVRSLVGLAELLAPSNTAEAAALFEKATKLSPKDQNAHGMLGVLYYKMGKFDDAVLEMKTALKLNPADRTTRSNLANILYMNKKYEESAGQYDELAALEPTDSQVQYSRGLAHEAAGDLDTAKTAFQAAVASDPTNALAENNLGVVLEKLGHRSQAFAAYKRALRIDPSLVAAKTNVGRLKN